MDVDLTGAKTVRFVVEDGGDGIDNDHADWADAVLTLKDACEEARHERRQGASRRWTSRRWTWSAPRIHGPRVVGGTPGREFLFRVPATGQGTLKFAYKNLPSTIRPTGDGRVLRGTVPPEAATPSP